MTSVPLCEAPPSNSVPHSGAGGQDSNRWVWDWTAQPIAEVPSSHTCYSDRPCRMPGQGWHVALKSAPGGDVLKGIRKTQLAELGRRKSFPTLFPGAGAAHNGLGQAQGRAVCTCLHTHTTAAETTQSPAENIYEKRASPAPAVSCLCWALAVCSQLYTRPTALPGTGQAQGRLVSGPRACVGGTDVR